MPILKCSVTDCCHNKKDECTLDEINVSGMGAIASASTQCDNFMAKGNAATSSVEEEKMGQPVVKIACNATKCKSNENSQCVADHVSVKDCNCESTNTKCDTECASFKCECE